MALSIGCQSDLALSKRNPRFVLCEPPVECLELRIETLCLADAASVAAILLKLAVELKHVAQVVGSRESE